MIRAIHNHLSHLYTRLGHATCAICGEAIERGEEIRWSAHMEGMVHLLCVPALVRTLGEDAVRVYLRHGPARLFPEAHRPGPVDQAEPERDNVLLRLLGAICD